MKGVSQGNLRSASTVRRRIRETTLRSRRMRKRFLLTPAHIAARERWAMQRVHWRKKQWQRVIFTDECRFRLFRSDGRIRVWRQSTVDKNSVLRIFKFMRDKVFLCMCGQESP